MQAPLSNAFKCFILALVMAAETSVLVLAGLVDEPPPPPTAAVCRDCAP